MPLSRVVLTVPKGGLTIESNKRGGATDNPRYFYLNERAGGVIVSGWFEPAERYKDLERSWRQEMEQMQRDGWPAPQDVERSDLGPWRAILYHYVLPMGGTSAHVRATFIGAGTWIDLHVSFTAAGPSSKTRPAVIALVRALQVREK